jgi:hypothetical protein
MRYWVVLPAVLLLGCATVTKGTDQTISLETPGHAGASCVLQSKSIGSRTVTTPATMTLPKSRHNVAVSCTLGCYKGAGIIESKLEGMTAGNVILGGVVGLGVDAASGAMNKYTEWNQIAMVEDPNCNAQ